MSFLSIENIRKNFGGLTILHDISIEIEQGDFLVLVGPSGCGKSTLLNIIAGLEQQSAGNIIIDGNHVNHTHPAKRDIAMVFQSYALYPNMTVRKNLSFGLEMHKVAKHEADARIKQVSHMLQIENLLDRKPAALSGGQRQRVAMGRALVRRPKIFLFDEPLSNLDAKLRVDMRSEIKRLHQNLKSTIVYVTHDQIEAMTLSTKIAVMNKGYIQQLGTADEIYRHPSNLFVAQFMGSPAMNIIKGKLVEHEGKPVFKMGDALISLPHDPAILQEYMNKDMAFGIRPENIAHQDNDYDVKAKIDLLEPTGADCYAILSYDNQVINARFAAGFQAKDDALTIAFDKKHIHLFDLATEKNILY